MNWDYVKSDRRLKLVRDGGFKVSPWGVLPFDYVRKRFSGFNRFGGFNGGVVRRIKIRSAAEI